MGGRTVADAFVVCIGAGLFVVGYEWLVAPHIARWCRRRARRRAVQRAVALRGGAAMIAKRYVWRLLIWVALATAFLAFCVGVALGRAGWFAL